MAEVSKVSFSNGAAPLGATKLKLQEFVARRNVRESHVGTSESRTSPVLRRYRQRVNYQRYEAKSDRAANDLSR